VTFAPFTFEDVAHGPRVQVHLGPDKKPVGATAAARIETTRERLWAVISDVSSYAGRVPMMHRVHRDGDRIHAQLRFRIALFSVGFEFTADARYEDGKWLELTHVAGEPKGLKLRFELSPTQNGATLVHAFIAFDVMSLGWLVKFFLKHHPEIRFGVFPGSALVLLDSVRRAVES
jgi:ribosome-associated toxin RatA of RatAB toxin-antitoxin module